MRIDVLTIFPRIVEAPLSDGIVQRAREAGIADLRFHDLREHTDDKHRSVDDAPSGRSWLKSDTVAAGKPWRLPNSTQTLRTSMETMDTGGSGGQKNGRRF